MTPIVSVLMPAYNAGPYVAEAVQSVLDQTVRDLELIVIDDGSADDTGATLEGLAARNTRLRIVRRGNRGIVASRNEALALASGEFVAVLDSDDMALPDRLERQLAYLRDHPECVAVGGQVLTIDSDGDPITRWSMPTTHDAIDAMALSGGSPGILHSTLCARRSVVQDLGGYREGLDTCEDHDLCLRLAERGQLASLDVPVVKYRLHPQSVSWTRLDLQIRLTARILEDAYRRRGLAGSPPVIDQQRPESPSYYHQTCGWQALTAGHRPTARKHARRALVAQPFNLASWRLAYCTFLRRD
jgi:glycosyltransferase involved in cell wall biosynthesis